MKILDFINELRETDGYISHIYLKGGCYKFHLLLKKMYPSSTPYISDHKNHIVTKYCGKFYDIAGIVDNVDGYTKLTPEETKIVEKWSFRKHNLLMLTECPNCDEPIVF